MRSWSALALLLSVLLAVPALAQRHTASVRGTVTDSTGSLVEGAKVTAINAETGFTRETETNESGNFSFGDLTVGSYVVEVSKDGFRAVVISNVLLNVADNREINAQLEVGEVTDEVTVEANALTVETIGGEVAGLITGEQVRELPLNGRNFVQLTQLMPGVASPEGFDTKNKGLLGGVDMSVSGSTTTGNLWTLDGANNNDVGSNRTILIYPSADAIEEMKVHRNSYGAEFGGAGGAVVNVVTRGGSNDFKGGVYYFKRDDSWNEKNFFLEEAGLDKENLNLDNYGFTLGGPIMKDKLHFFVSQEWNIEERGIVRSGFVPTAAERAGDFSGPAIAGCTGAVPIDPLTGQPFPGNMIPGDRLSEAGSNFLNLYPLPNVNPASGSCRNYVAAVDTPIDWAQTNLRLDYNVSDKTRVMLRYTQDDWDNEAPNAGGGNGLWGDDQFAAVDSNWSQPSHSIVAQLNQTLGNNAINTLQYSDSGNEINITRGGTNPALNNQINANIPALFGDKTGGADRSHPVFWGGGGYDALWTIAPWNNEQDLKVLKDDYQQVFGDHYFKAGVLYSDNIKRENIGGSSSFETPQFWGAAGVNGWGATTGNVLSDFLLQDMTFGFSENSFQPNPTVEWQDFEFYVSDSWQVSSNLTVDYGVRYSRYFEPAVENNAIASFDPDSYDPALGNDPCNGLLLPPDSASACADAGFQGGTAGPNDSLTNEDEDNFAPRLGLAWDVFGDGRSALRAGFGQYFQRERVAVLLDFAGSPPYAASRNGIRKLDSAEEPCGGCFSSAFGAPTRGIALTNETPYTLQWNLTWEQRLGQNSTIEVGYVGSRGKHLMRRSDINQVSAADLDGNGVSDRLDYVRANGNPGALGALRPFSAWGDASILYWENDGESEYHSLQSQFQTRFGRGSQLQASYTWSSFKSNDPLTDSGAGTFAGQILDRDDPRSSYGYAGLHREHIFNASVIWNLPDLEGSSSLTRALFGGWQIGSVVAYASGQALTVTTGSLPTVNGPSGTGFVQNQRPNRVAGASCRGGGSPTQWLNPGAWTLNGFQLGSIGDAGVGECEGPDFFQVDLSFYKNIPITDRLRGQFRIEVFNVFNRDNFTGVNTVLGSTGLTLDSDDLSTATSIVSSTPTGTFGQATGVRDPRQVQMGFKLSW